MATVELVPSEALKSETIGSRVGVAGEQPYRAGQGRAALHAGVGDIFKIVQPGTAIQLRGCDGRDGRHHHPVSAMWAGEKEARQARCRNTQVSHGTPPIRTYPTTWGPISRSFHKSVNKYLCDAQSLCVAAMLLPMHWSDEVWTDLRQGGRGRDRCD